MYEDLCSGNPGLITCMRDCEGDKFVARVSRYGWRSCGHLCAGPVEHEPACFLHGWIITALHACVEALCGCFLNALKLLRLIYVVLSVLFLLSAV